jgi:anti-anti-sigma factor
LESKPAEILIINLAEVKHIDSSALGMLLVLRSHTEAANKTLLLANPSAVVKKILEIACFSKLFTITG